MNTAKNEEQRVLSPEEGRAPVDRCILQGLDDNGGIPAWPLRTGGLEAGSCSKQAEWLWETNPTELTPKQLAI